MTKRLTIALVALVALVLVAVLPASASFYPVNSTINQGATIFYGEQGLNVTHALNHAYMQSPNNLTTTDDGAINQYVCIRQLVGIGCGGQGYQPGTDRSGVHLGLEPVCSAVHLPVHEHLVYDHFGRDPALDVSGNPIGVFSIQDPSLAVNIWDADQH